MSIRRQRNWVYPPDIRGIADVEKHLRKHYTEHVDESVERIKDFVDNISSMDTDDIAEGASNLYFTAERCQDTAGGMFTGNTETFITATYQDGDGTVDLVVPVKDEDNMTSDSDTHLATQQSIKAYVDTEVASINNLTIDPATNRAYACDSQSDAWLAASMFTAKINSGGTGGLTATNVPYDNDSNEGVVVPHSSYVFDGYLVLHNITKSTERFIDDVDIVNNYITTVSSSDSWADNDDITAESQTCTAGTPRFMDLDLSGVLPASAYAVIIEAGVFGSGVETLYLHPYEAFGAGKVQQIRSDGNGNGIYRTFLMKVNSQRICIAWNASGAGTLETNLRIVGYWS